MLDFRMVQGQCSFTPIALKGPTMTIRKFTKPITSGGFSRLGSLKSEKNPS